MPTPSSVKSTSKDLVHGGFVDGSGWEAVYQAEDLTVGVNIMVKKTSKKSAKVAKKPAGKANRAHFFPNPLERWTQDD